MNGTPKKNQIKRQNKLENENLCSKHQPISQALQQINRNWTSFNLKICEFIFSPKKLTLQRREEFLLTAVTGRKSSLHFHHS